MNRRAALKTGVLTGVAVTMPTLLSILQSCKQETRQDWQPEFFSKEEARTIAELVDIILPRTDTPGALDVKVDFFIDKVIARTYDEEGKQNMRAEIEQFNHRCKSKYADSFSNLSQDDKIRALEHEEKASPKFSPGIWGKTVGEQKPVGFYRSMKSMAIWAYFTSEEIGKNVLSYDPIPGNYNGCIPLRDVGNKWSL